MDKVNGYLGKLSASEGFLVIGLLTIWTASSLVVIALHNALIA